jgi:hypothetical protein
MQAFKDAVAAENSADVAFIHAVNSTLSAGKSDYASAIVEIEKAITALMQALRTLGVADSNLSAVKSERDDIHQIHMALERK